MTKLLNPTTEMTIGENTGLVLEGGGMRGVFTSGVLDYFLDAGITFPYCVSVSAGACNGLSYMSLQRGRAKLTNIDMLEKYRYIGMKYLWTQHSILDRRTIYDDIPNHILPFDYDTCFRNPMTFEMVTTNCLTGKACYLTEREDADRLIALAKASSSLPYVCPIVWINHQPMLDGGIADSIPVLRAIETGHAFNVVVLTRNRGYRDLSRDVKIPKYIYRRFPRLRLLLSKRHAIYNEQLEMVERMEDEGTILAIRPKQPMQVGRLESDVAKLTDLYNEGYTCAREAVEGWLRRTGGSV